MAKFRKSQAGYRALPTALTPRRSRHDANRPFSQQCLWVFLPGFARQHHISIKFLISVLKESRAIALIPVDSLALSRICYRRHTSHSNISYQLAVPVFTHLRKGQGGRTRIIFGIRTCTIIFPESNLCIFSPCITICHSSHKKIQNANRDTQNITSRTMTIRKEEQIARIPYLNR